MFSEASPSLRIETAFPQGIQKPQLAGSWGDQRWCHQGAAELGRSLGLGHWGLPQVDHGRASQEQGRKGPLGQPQARALGISLRIGTG